MKILICGGGALGSHALQLGRDLGADLAVVDDDRVETKNLASQWFVKQMVGKNKPCLHGGLAADGGFGVVRWDEDFTIDSEDVPGQPTCEGAGFLPLITMVSAALVRSIRGWMENDSRRNWNVSASMADSF
jgi:hypothetical protein